MSDQTFPNMDIREQAARIDRAIVESGRLQEETRKFVAEQNKLNAEARKLGWDTRLAPLGIFIAAAASLGTLLAILLGHH